MAVWAGGDDRVVGTTTTTTLRDGGDMIPVSVYHSAFCFCRPVQSRGCMVPWIYYTLPCKMGCSSRTDGSHCSMNGSKKRFGTDRKNRDASSRKVSGTKEDQVGDDGMCFRD